MARRTLVMVVTSLWLMSHGQTTEAGEPQELLRQTLTGVLAVLTDDTLKAPAQSQARLERLAQVVAPSFDFKEMARRSLGHEWHRLTPAQQEEFVRFFSPLLLQSLVQRIAYRATTSATGYGSIPTTIHYQRETIDPDGDASVQTVMTYAHEQTTEAIEYLLSAEKRRLASVRCNRGRRQYGDKLSYAICDYPPSGIVRRLDHKAQDGPALVLRTAIAAPVWRRGTPWVHG